MSASFTLAREGYLSQRTYVPLWCKTNYSFLEGASTAEELIATSKGHGLPAIVVTDRNGFYGIVKAYVASREANQMLIAGSEVSIDDGSTILLLAKTKAGYSNLCRLLSKGHLRNQKGQMTVSWEEVCSFAPGLIALWIHNGSKQSTLHTQLDALHAAYGDELYAVISRHREAADIRIERETRELAAKFGISLVAATEVLYHTQERRRLQDVLTCIRHGVTIMTAGTLVKANAEHYLLSPEEMYDLYHDDPGSVERTLEVAAKCTFSLADLRYNYPEEDVGDGMSVDGSLRRLTYNGAQERYPGGVPPKVATQIEKELAIIAALEYSGYFLTMHKIVQYCKEKGILCQGRGSAANSAVCFCLGVTAIDPTKVNLLFERFLSMERKEPPDIDLDIEHNRREEVIQHMYKEYDNGRAAMVANVVSYRARSAFREVGKVFGISEVTLDQCAKRLSHWDSNVVDGMIELDVDLDSAINKNVAEITGQIISFPRHLGIHPGGFLLGSEPVCEIVPIENATMEKRTVIQWDKRDIEELGLFKVDLLGLGALSQLYYSFNLLKQHYGNELTMATIPSDDIETYDMICRADTVGVFQIESRAQMSMLPRLRPRYYYDLVVEVSIVRPGPITGGMVHPYLRRRDGIEKFEYPHPALKAILKRTYGVPLFQEQAMEIAMVGAGYSSEEVDTLRKDMAAWTSKGKMYAHEERLIDGMTSKGIPREFAQRVYDQIKGFGEYGFPESHAASFALIAYATSYIKCHYPDVFACSLLNAWPMGFYSPATIIDDAKRHQVIVVPIDVTKSEWDCTLEAVPEVMLKKRKNNKANHDPSATASDSDEKTVAPNAIRIGMRYLKGLTKEDWETIKKQRARRPFSSLLDFKTRVPLDREVLEKLALSGALECFGVGRRSTLWAVIDEGSRDLVVTQSVHFSNNAGSFTTDIQPRTSVRDAITSTINLSAEQSATGKTQFELLEYRESKAKLLKLNDAELIDWDYTTSQHSARGHPLAPLRRALKSQGLPNAKQVLEMDIPSGQNPHISYAGYIICRQKPGTAKGVVFLTMEDETGFVNTIIWPDVYREFRVKILTNQIIGVSGRLQKNGAKDQEIENSNKSTVVYIVAEKFWVPKLPFNAKTPEIKSRDFH